MPDAPATLGSYGEPPSGYRLPEATRLGPVTLQVADLARSVAWYEGTLGLRATARGSGTGSLSAADGSVLVHLVERRGVRPVGRGLLGLYHFAILLPDRTALGHFIRHLAERGVRAGAADHLVSEALYLTDPDGLGIEVYADRPRDAWRRQGRELVLATEPLDVASVVAKAGDTPWSGMPAGTVMGHIHLHVGDLAEASRFYSEGLGFDRMSWSYPGALFLGAGGYHHHVGTNTWAGPGARRPREDDAQLLQWTLEVPTAREVHSFCAHLGLEEATTRDPWGTRVVIRSAA